MLAPLKIDFQSCYELDIRNFDDWSPRVSRGSVVLCRWHDSLWLDISYYSVCFMSLLCIDELWAQQLEVAMDRQTVGPMQL